MSSNAEQSESQSGAAQPEVEPAAAATPSPADPDLKENGDESTDVRPSEVVEENASLPNQEQATDAEVSKSDENLSQVGEVRDLDPKTDESGDVKVESNDAQSNSKLNKDEGNRTFTMRELLNELKNSGTNEDSEADNREAGTPYSQESTPKHNDHKNNVSMELLDSVTGADEEGRSRQRILTFAAKRYASALERNPEDYDALYNWALVLQESADNVCADSVSPSKDALLEEACRKYDEATRLCPTLNDAYYNWAIAISDRAKIRGRTKEAEEFWKQATKNYEKAVQLNWNSPQALNNWGLALQELSTIVPAREKQSIVRTAISKFRAAIQLQFDFHRAIYNLGTVLYGLAEDMSRTGGHINAKEVSPNELYSQSAIYIAAAHALKPNYSVYSSALKLVRSMLPLPYLKVGYLTAPPAGNPIAPHGDWKHTEFVLNHEGLQQILKVDPRHFQNLSPKSGERTSVSKQPIRVDIRDIVSVSTCADLTLPPGAGLSIDTIHGPVFLIADSWEALDGWLDAIRLVYTIYARGKRDVLAGIITA